MLHAWILLTHCYLKLHSYEKAVTAAARADKLLQTVNNAKIALRNSLDILYVEALSHTCDGAKLKLAIELGQKVITNI